MKMKKLLSIGALGLVLACSTSIGASAATTTSTTDLIKVLLENQYNNGTNQTGLLLGVDKNSQLSTLLPAGFTTEMKAQLADYATVTTILTKFGNNENLTVKEALDKVTSDQATFEKFQSKFVTIAQEIQNLDSLKGDARATEEKKVIVLLNEYNNKLAVTFGKDGEGRTTASITNSGSIVIQLNSDNSQTIIDEINGLSWTSVSAAKALLG